MILSKMKLAITVFFLFTFLVNVPHIIGQERTKRAQIIRTKNPPKIDGLIGDECWENVEPVSGFFQFDPVNGIKASEETLVWVAYDQKNIYFAYNWTAHNAY